MVAPPPVAPAPEAPPTATLWALENAPDQPIPIQLAKFPAAIGSHPERADVVFAHPTVSRLHARLTYSHGVYLLYDEGSANGTLVNGERLGLAPRVLQDGDEIAFGRVKVRFGR